MPDGHGEGDTSGVVGVSGEGEGVDMYGCKLPSSSNHWSISSSHGDCKSEGMGSLSKSSTRMPCSSSVGDWLRLMGGEEYDSGEQEESYEDTVSVVADGEHEL